MDKVLVEFSLAINIKSNNNRFFGHVAKERPRGEVGRWDGDQRQHKHGLIADQRVSLSLQ